MRRAAFGPRSTLYSDGLDVYKVAARCLLAKHGWVNHGAYEYVSMDDPAVHINGAESCFAWMRQALRRIDISQENLTRYVAQAELILNRREVPVIDRMRELASREHGSLTPDASGPSGIGSRPGPQAQPRSRSNPGNRQEECPYA